MSNYLPRIATTEEACAWLRAKTGESWRLARLLEYRVMPWLWLDYAPGLPDIFGDRLEGYLAPMIFSGDTGRLAAGATDVLLTMTKAHDGKLFRRNPGLTEELSALRFKRDDLEELAASFAAASGAPKKGGASVQPDDWKEAARAIADECFEHDTNAKPSVRDNLKGYSSRVMAEMQRRKIHGPQGVITNQNTIQREALQGPRWWAGKVK